MITHILLKQINSLNTSLPSKDYFNGENLHEEL